MTDIIERLRDKTKPGCVIPVTAESVHELMGLAAEAADEIERLRGALDIATLQIKSLGRTLEENDLIPDWLPTTPPKPSSKKNRL